MLSGRSGDEKKSRNKEDKSNSWDQEVLHMLMTFVKYVYELQNHIYNLQGDIAKVSRELSHSMSTKRIWTISDIAA